MVGLARDLVIEIVRTVHVLGFLLIDVHAILLVDLGVPLPDFVNAPPKLKMVF